MGNWELDAMAQVQHYEESLKWNDDGTRYFETLKERLGGQEDEFFDWLSDELRFEFEEDRWGDEWSHEFLDDSCDDDYDPQDEEFEEEPDEVLEQLLADPYSFDD